MSLNNWRSSHHPIHVRAVLQQELDRVARAVVARDVQSRRRMRSILLMLIDIHASLEQQLRELEASREVFAVSRCGESPSPWLVASFTSLVGSASSQLRTLSTRPLVASL